MIIQRLEDQLIGVSTGNLNLNLIVETVKTGKVTHT